MALVTFADYARHRGVTRSAVYYARDRGLLVLGDGGKVDLDASDARWAADGPPEPAGLTRARGGPVAVGSADDDGERRNAADTRKAIAAAGLAELALAQKRGELVPVVDVQRAWYGLVRASRDRLLGLPDRISADIASMADQHEVRVYLDREIRGALAELTEPEGGADGG